MDAATFGLDELLALAETSVGRHITALRANHPQPNHAEGHELRALETIRKAVEGRALEHAGGRLASWLDEAQRLDDERRNLAPGLRFEGLVAACSTLDIFSAVQVVFATTPAPPAPEGRS
jgi:hypothetical protein